MKLHDAVDVWLDLDGEALRAGRLRASFQGGRTLAGCSFEYDAGFLAAPEGFELSPDLPLVAGRQYSAADATLFSAFADASPDDWGTSLLNASYARTRSEGSPSTLGEFDYLVQLNDQTRLGSLRFTPIDKREWLAEETRTAARETNLTALAAAAARFEAYEATNEDVELLGVTGSSLGGARPKATIIADGRLSLVKFPSNRDRRIDIEAWEATALDIALDAGIRVPTHTLVRVKSGKSTLVIDRFDRIDTRPSHPVRLPYISAATAMRLSLQQIRTYEDFADTVATLTRSRSQSREMFARVALNVLVGNVDDHWRNHGFIREHGAWTLSPVFDVNPVRAHNGVQARQISDRDDPTRRDIRLLLEGADVYGLSAAAAATVLAPVVVAVKRWQTYAAANGITAQEIQFMESAFDSAQLHHVEEYIHKWFPPRSQS